MYRAKAYGDEGTDQAQDYEIIQCTWGMYVTGFDLWHLAVLFGGNRLRMYEIRRDEALIAQLLDVAAEFWDCVRTGTPPSPTTGLGAKLRWPASVVGRSVQASPMVAETVEALRSLKDTALSIAKQIEPLEDMVRVSFADAEVLVDESGNMLATYKSAKGTQVLDIDQLKADLPNVYQAYLKEKPGSRRLIIK